MLETKKKSNAIKNFDILVTSLIFQQNYFDPIKLFSDLRGIILNLLAKLYSFCAEIWQRVAYYVKFSKF